jgi:hypothetical protein
MKYFILLSSLLFSSMIFGQQQATREIQVIARIKATEKKIELIRSLEGDAIPSLLKNKELEETVKKMLPGDEAIVRGYISYEGLNQIEGPISTDRFLL